MKKKFTKITSCLLCLALLLSMAGPALAVIAEDNALTEVFFEDLLNGEEIIFSPDSGDAVNIDAPAAGEDDSSYTASLPAEDVAVSPFAETGEYEIYPTPQSVTYGSGTVTLPATMQVTYGAGIDQYTKDRAVEAFKEAGVTLSTSATTAVKLSVTIGDTGNNGKYDAYKLTINASGMTVIGKDTDAAFYGLTTVKRILQQVENRQVKYLTVEDYADVPFRGFIEGYYGNPWTVDDRAALMEFGGEYKMNIYFYAPKDDPKHSTKWRELYTDAELETKIRPLAEAGNKSKCYYGFALHPFWADGINYADETQYAADLEVLKAKFEQVMEVGVRQIAVLADDRGLPTVNGSYTEIQNTRASYVKLMTDLTNWVKSDEMQAKYPGLKTSIPFCPNAYMNNGSSDQIKTLVNELPDSVPIVLTGGAIWGHVSHSFLNTYKANTSGGRTFMWVNWPCSDNSKTSLTMGAHNVILHSDLTEDDINTLQGVMINPMQQSEASKAGIFQLADYTWNIWNGSDSAQRTADVWDDCFKYVDHDSAIETAESAALRELSKHMIRQNGNGNNSYNESVALAPTLTAFRQKLSAGTLTAAEVAAMRAEFQTLNDAATLYKSKTSGNTRILGSRNADGSYPSNLEQMAPWLDCWVDFSQANLDLLDALAATLDNADGSKDNTIVSKYLSGQSNLTASQGHKFYYVDHNETAKVGGQHLIPFTDDLLATVAEEAKTIIDPTILVERIITSRSDVSDLSALRDGDDSTKITFTSPSSLSEGDYIGVKYNQSITLNSVNFKLGDSSADGGKNTFGACKLQYTEDGTTWQDIPGTPTIVNNTMNNNWSGSCRVAEIGMTGLSLKAKGVRVVSTEDVNDVWIVVREIYINGQSGEQTDEPAETGAYSYTAAVGGNMIVAPSYGQLSYLSDGNESTICMFKGSSSDTVPQDGYLQLDLGSPKPIGSITIKGDPSKVGDGFGNAQIQYAMPGAATTTVVQNCVVNTTTGSFTVDLSDRNITAQTLYIVNAAVTGGWVRIAELTITPPRSESNSLDKIIYQSDAVKKLTNPSGGLEDDSANLRADNVSLRAGEFIGIALPQLRLITELIADYTPVPGLMLKVGMNEAEMEVIETYADAGSGAARLFAADDTVADFTGLARYIRLENESSQNISFRLNELNVELAPLGGESITYVSANGCQPETNSDDPLAWFDGDVGTRAKFSAAQRVGNWVLYDLGQTREITSLRATINNTDNDYPRNGVWELSDSQDGPWTTVLTITTTLGEGQTDFNNPPSTNGSTEWQHDTANYFYQENTLQTPVSGRYLRYRVTSESSNYLRFNEITINGGEYVSTFNDPAYTVDPIEPSADFTPDKMRDKDLTSGFRPNMDGKTSGSIIYRLSDETSIGQINIVEGAASNAKVSIRAVGEETFKEIGTMTGGLGQFPIAEDVTGVAEIKLSWGNVTPTFYEIITVPRETVAKGGGQASSDAETIAINSYAGDDRVYNFDENWKFNLGDASGADGAVYNDAAWRTVNLPHDYSIEGEFDSTLEAESGYLKGGIGWYRKSFTIDPTWENKVVAINFGGVYMDCEIYLNGTKLGEHHYGYSPFAFVLPGDLLNYTGENVIAVKTDDAFPSSRWYSGAGIYRSVHLTVTTPVHVAKYGTKVTTTNAGAVTVKTTVENSGSSAASVTVEQAIYELDSTTYEKKGSAVVTASGTAASPAAGATAEVTQTLNVSSPKLWNSWDKGEPNLYVLVTTVKQGSTVLDTYETEFGFRTIEFTSTVGFKLNGQNLKLKGVCQHHDQGALGAEAWYRALERQVDILMDMGCNSIRVTHNPAADELIEICNRKGVLIIDEMFDGWHKAKNGNGNDFSRWFSQTIASDNALVGKQANDTWAKYVIQTVVKRDMNSPCVIMYSLGNEIAEGAGFDANFATNAANLITWAKAVDDTRPLTFGQNNTSKDDLKTAVADKIHAAGGVIGINYYGSYNFETAHNSWGWLVYASETVSHINSRGVYNNKVWTSNSWANAENAGLDRLTSYDKNAVGWGAVASDGWWRTIKYDYDMGEYIWTGFDYIGEPTPWNNTGTGKTGTVWAKNSFFGAIDTNGLPKDNYWLYRSMWNDKSHTLHILPTWDEDDIMIENGKVEVVVYTDAPMVKLYLNSTEVGTATSTTHTTDAGHVYRTFNSGTGAFVGKNATSHETLYATFNVTYAEGTLRAVACDANGQPLSWVTQGRSEVKTTSGASKLVAEADRATIKNDGRDLSYITISVTDRNGNIVNGADNAITVAVEGDGVFMGMDNGVQADHTSYLSKTRQAGAGQLVAIVQSTKAEGKFTLTATAPGLSPTSVTVKTAGAVSTTSGKTPVSYDLAKTIYVQLNTEPTLPATATVNLADGTSVSDVPITWNDYDKSLLSTAGSEFAITGTIEGYNISVSVGVVVLDDIAALLNYSAAIQPILPSADEQPSDEASLPLPASRPAVMADGTVVNAQFNVTWEPVTYKQVSKPGTLIVNGTAEAFGKTYDVTATIRISKGEYIEGGSVSSAVVRPTVNGVANNDLLKAFDGSATTAWRGSGAAQVEFDTAQNLYRIVLTYATTVPTGANAPIITLDDGAVSVKPKVSGTTVTYDLGEIRSSTSVALNFSGQEVALANVQLINATPVFSVGSTAEFDGLKVNGLDVAADQLAAKVIKTSAENAVITPISDDNVAVTILPENSDSQIIVVTESEDHTSRAVYTIQLDAPKEVEATDSSHDYDRTLTTATAGSDNGTTVGSAVDGNESSIWHSAYSGTSPEGAAADHLVGFPEKRWFQLELQQATELVALRYKPRPSQTNGTVKDYKIEVSQDGKTWTTVATGSWSSSADWKIAMFDRTVTAKYVKLWGINTYGDGNQANYFMTAAEVRVVTPAENDDDKIDLSAATIAILKDGAPFPGPFHWKNLDLRPGDPNNSNVDDDITVTVTLYGEVLQPGVDYTLDYDNNVEPGTAYIYARAKENSTKYQGAAATTFQIVQTEDKITSFQPVILRVYPGVAPELPTEVLATKEDQHRANVPVTWGDVSEDWYNYPADNTADLTLTGTVKDEDMLAENTPLPTLTLKLIAFQSADTVSLVTPVGVAPVLPSTVTVRFADGTSAERAVTWDTSGKNWSTAGTVPVTGDIEGVSHNGATANVRVAAGSGAEKLLSQSDPADTNVNQFANTSIFPFAMAWHSSGNNNPYVLIDGTVSSNWNAGWASSGEGAYPDRWSDWQSGQAHDNIWAGVAFKTSTTLTERKEAQTLTLENKIVNRAVVRFIDESASTTASSAVTYPATYDIQYYTGPTKDLVFDTRLTTGDSENTGNGRVRGWTGSPLLDDSNWKTVTYTGTKPAIVLDSTADLNVTFEPVTTSIIRVKTTHRDGTKWVGMTKLEVYGEDLPAANSNFTVTSITLGGEEKKDAFQDKVLTVQLGADADIPTLAVTASDNASIAITQASRVPGAAQAGGAWAQAVITSEDGSKSEAYTVKFTREGADTGYFIDLDIRSNADKLTVTSPTGSAGGAAGTEITISVAKGYQLTDLWVQIADGDRAGELIKVTDGKFLMPADNVTFSAGVSPIVYKLTYDLNGGSMSTNNPRTYTVESNSFTLNNPTRGGYTFAGWVGGGLTSPTQTAVVQKGSIGDRSYIATWSENAGIGGSGGNNNGGTSSGSSAANPNSGITSAGNVVTTTTNPVTGATTVTTATPSGLVTAVTTGKDGQQTAVIQVPENSGSSVDAAMPALDVDGDKAPVVKIQNNTGRPLSVTVPFNGSDTVVAVRQEKDGTETVIPMSVVDEDGLRLKTQPGDQTIRLVENKKTFEDVPDDHWAAKAVNFTSSRELFNGVGDNKFAPTMPMNRAMMTTVLWRLAEKPDAALETLFDDVQPDSYYEEAVAWGVATGVVKGTDVGFEPDTAITRETLATLLYRAAGSPAVVDEMPRRFTDGAQVADWAQAAMVWCIQNDIIKGYPDNTLGAKGVATRAEVATMLQRFVDRQV